MLGDALGQLQRGWFGTATARQFHASDVHQTIQEGAGGENDALGIESHAEVGLDTRGDGHLPSSQRGGLCKKMADLVLPDVQVGGVLQHLAPRPDELAAVALRTRAPHGRSLGAVEHTELQGAGIRDAPHGAAHSIYFSDNLSFSNAANSGIT